MLQFTDAVALGKPRMTRDGYMVVDARVGRTGIQLYRGSELDKKDMPMVRVFRPEEEVFAADAMTSAAFRPVTMDHPTAMVDAKTWKEVSIGMTGDTVARDGEFLRVPFTLMDGNAIGDVQGGKRELSLGYYATIDWTPGNTPSGEQYDAVQRNIRINHLAVVDAARAGHSCRIGDSSWSTPPSTERNDPDMPDNLRTVLVDGISIAVTDQGAQAIEKLQRQLLDGAASHMTAMASKDAEIAGLRDSGPRAVQAKDGEIAALNANHAKAIEAKDGEIAGLQATHRSAVEAKDGEIAALKAKMPTAETMDALIAERASVIDSARKILGDSWDGKGKTLAEVRRAAVQKRLGDGAVTDKSDDYVTAAFDTLTAVAQPQQAQDPIRFQLAGGQNRVQATDSDGEYDKYVASLRDGWKAGS